MNKLSSFIPRSFMSVWNTESVVNSLQLANALSPSPVIGVESR